MAFPVIASSATTNGTTATTTPAITMPSGIVAGDLLLVIFRTAVGTAGVAWPGDWTELVESIADASDDSTAIGYKVAAGGDTLTLTTSSAKFAACAYRITGQATGAPQISAEQISTTTTPNPPSFTPAGGAKDYLWIWAGGWEGEQTSPPAGNPTNYTLGVIGADSGTAAGVTTNCRVALAARQLNAATEDPPSWTISAADEGVSWTIAINPSGAQALAGTTAGVSVLSASGSNPSVAHPLAGRTDGRASGTLLPLNTTNIEADASGWEVETNCTIARSTVQKRTGVASLAITSVAAGDMSARTPGGTFGTPVIPGISYTANIWFRAATAARTVITFLNWFDGAGAYLSTDTGSTPSDTTSGWTESTGTFVAPPTAAYGQIVASIGSTGAAGEVHYIDDIDLKVTGTGSGPVGTLGLAVILEGTTSGVSTALTGANQPDVARLVTGSSAGSSAATGSLTVFNSARLSRESVEALGQVIPDAHLSRGSVEVLASNVAQVAGATDGVSTATASLATAIGLAGVTSGVSSVSGAENVIYGLTGSSAGVSTTAAPLSVGSFHLLAGYSAGVSTAEASLATDFFCPYFISTYAGVLMCVGGESIPGAPFGVAQSNVEELCIVWC